MYAVLVDIRSGVLHQGFGLRIAEGESTSKSRRCSVMCLAAKFKPKEITTYRPSPTVQSLGEGSSPGTLPILYTRSTHAIVNQTDV